MPLKQYVPLPSFQLQQSTILAPTPVTTTTTIRGPLTPLLTTKQRNKITRNSLRTSETVLVSENMTTLNITPPLVPKSHSSYVSGLQATAPWRNNGPDTGVSLIAKKLQKPLPDAAINLKNKLSTARHSSTTTTSTSITNTTSKSSKTNPISDVLAASGDSTLPNVSLHNRYFKELFIKIQLIAV